MGTCCCSASTSITATTGQVLPTPQVRGVSEPGQVDGYTVVGMTCGHCVSSVTRHVNAIPGVHDVGIDLESGHLTFTAEAPVAREAVEAAVDQAGYRLA